MVWRLKSKVSKISRCFWVLILLLIVYLRKSTVWWYNIFCNVSSHGCDYHYDLPRSIFICLFDEQNTIKKHFVVFSCRKHFVVWYIYDVCFKLSKKKKNVISTVLVKDRLLFVSCINLMVKTEEGAFGLTSQFREV